MHVPLKAFLTLINILLLTYSGSTESDILYPEEEQVLLCYFAEWSHYRFGPGAFYVNNIDPFLCTHIVYAFVGMNETTNEIQSRDPYGDYELNGKGMIAEVTTLRSRNPSLKIMVSCGGWSEGSIKFSTMAASPSRRRIFINSVLSYLRKHKFDGFDMAWEYPADRGGVPEDKQNFAKLLEELRTEFDTHNYILTAQLMSKRFIVEPGYDIPRISKALDYISLVTYQLHNAGERKTGPNAPLNSLDDLNVESGVNLILRKGAPPGKVLLGFATYGHQYLIDENVEIHDNNYMGVPASTTYEGPWSKEAGFIGYNEVCYEISSGALWKEYWDSNSSTPFAVNERKFMSYDNRESYREKLKLMRRKNLGGAMVWSIDTDDFKGLCHSKRYPLISEIKSFMSKTNTGVNTDSINTTVISHEYRKK